MTKSALDITLLIACGLFAVTGWRKGFAKKVISLLALIVSLALAAKFGASLSDAAYVPLGLRPGVAIVFAYITIIGAIMLAQAVFYSLLVRDIVEGLWNHIAGMVLGVAEGALALSVALIFLSIYFGIPSEETKATSTLYIPMKNFAPRVYDTAYNLFPEVEDFYQQLYNAFAEPGKTGANKK
jgi:uncharacterized membrane protein required for colicin V production